MAAEGEPREVDDPDPGYDDIPGAPPRASAPPASRPPQAPSGATIDRPREAIDLGGPPRDDDAAYWIPRVAFFPLWVVGEYVVRKPTEAVFLGLEEVGILEAATDDDREKPPSATDLAFAPAAQIDAGFRPMFGAYGRVDNVIVEGWEVRGVGLFGGPGAMKVHLEGNAPLTGDSRAWAELGAMHRDDLLYWGKGARSLDENESTFSMSSVEGRVSVHVPLLRGDVIALEAWMRLTGTNIGNGDCDDAAVVGPEGAPQLGCEESTLFERVRAGTFAMPPGVDDYAVLGAGTRFRFDTRPNQSPRDTGFDAEIYGEQASDIEWPHTGAWLRWGALTTASLDFTRTNRVISLRLDARFAEPYGSFQVPLGELVGAPGLGSDPDRELLRGFRPGRLVGESAVAAAVEYRWPIWAAADARLEMGVGNAFASNLIDFQAQLLRYSLSGGVEVPFARRHRILFLAGFGTETFEQGADPTSARIYLGGTTPL